MIILGVLIILVVICIIGIIFSGLNYKDDFVWIFGLIIFGTLLFVWSSSIPVGRYKCNSNLKQLQAFEMTLDNMRQKESIENAAIQIEIAKWNQWIAGKKYWNDTLFDIWIPDEIETIEFIR
jgi:hypothetical protein